MKNRRANAGCTALSVSNDCFHVQISGRLTINVAFDSVRNDTNEDDSSGLNLHE